MKSVMNDIPTANIDITHHLQRQILLQLRQNGVQTYQQLKPEGVEGNAYNYHLKNLKKSGLIRSIDGGYELSETGERVMDAFSFGAQRLVFRPHAYTYLLVTSGDKVLLYRPSRQPMPGMLCLPSGKLHYGDSVSESVAREAVRRDLSSDYVVSSICPINVRYLRDTEMVLHRPGNLWHLNYGGPLSTSTTPSGHSKWFERSELPALPDLLPEVTLALERLASGSHEPIDMEWNFRSVG